MNVRLTLLAIVVTTLLPLSHGGLPEAVQYLAFHQDYYHRTYDVYTDADAAGNHFFVRGRMGEGQPVPPMEEDFAAPFCRGLSCIRAEFRPWESDWGGWYFMNGVYGPGDRAPRLNWGEVPHAGVDLRGATELRFWARGETGDEEVEFFCEGVGWRGWVRVLPYSDSSPKVSTGQVKLSREWREFRLDLRNKDLRYVVGGFGWVTSGSLTRRLLRRPIVFYLDDIRYELARLDEPRLLLSYETVRSNDRFDRVMRNVAFVYDNAVALMAFLAAGDERRARLIAQALVEAMHQDRFYEDGRLRNAYQAGDLRLPPGWAPNGRARAVRLPGYYDARSGCWMEDAYQVGTNTGNMAWAMLALLAFYEATGESRWLEAAGRLGEWVDQHCRDERGAGGYMAGYEGWEPNPRRLTYKSTEHNIDLAAAFRRLFRATQQERWRQRSLHAARFVKAMWDAKEGKFWTGVLDDGVTINRSVIPLDVQAWAFLALGWSPDGIVDPQSLRRGLDYAEQHLRVGDGYDYNQDRDGVWLEGTAQMALAYRLARAEGRSRQLLVFLASQQLASGALPAAQPERLTTGFGWYYYRRPHVGATAWYVLAERGLNPFAPFPGQSKGVRPSAPGPEGMLSTGFFGFRFVGKRMTPF